jgi:nitroreductase
MEEQMEEVHKLLELPKEVAVFSLFALGYPAESRAQEDRFHPERIHFLE